MRIAVHGAMVGATALVAAALLPSAGIIAQDSPASVTIDAPGRVDPGADGFDIAVKVENATDLGGFEIRLTYDSAVIAPDKEGELGIATKGEFLGSSGREVICPEPEVQGSLVLIRCVSLGMEPAAPKGGGTLATFHFVPIGKGTSDLTFSLVRLLSPDGETDYEVNAIDDSIRVAKADSSSMLRNIIAVVAIVAILAVGAAYLQMRRRRA